MRYLVSICNSLCAIYMRTENSHYAEVGVDGLGEPSTAAMVLECIYCIKHKILVLYIVKSLKDSKHRSQIMP